MNWWQWLITITVLTLLSPIIVAVAAVVLMGLALVFLYVCDVVAHTWRRAFPHGLW